MKSGKLTVAFSTEGAGEIDQNPLLLVCGVLWPDECDASNVTEKSYNDYRASILAILRELGGVGGSGLRRIPIHETN